MPQIVTLTLNPALDITTSTAEVRPTHKLRCGPPRYDPGGGGINVARVVHALGGDVVAVFPCGGPAGMTLERLLQQAGVPIRPIPIAGATRESLTVDETETHLQYRFVLPGPVLAAAETDALIEALAAGDAAPEFIVASGSVPPATDLAIFKRLGERCRSLRARLVIDTSGPALAACEGAGAYLIKPSLRELEDLTGRSLPTPEAERAAARELIARGFAEVVLLSLGERGALVVGPGVAEEIAAVQVPIASTVGAGDSMVGAVTWALARGDSLIEAARLGVAAGAAALMTPGTQLARAEDVARLYASMPRPSA